MATPASAVAPDDRLDDLANQLSIAKQQESLARQNRITLEEQILDLVGCKEEGSTNVHTDHYRLTTTGRITRSVNEDALKGAYRGQILPSPLLDRVFKQKHTVDLTQLRYVQNNEPEYYDLLCKIITSKPGKPSIAVKDAV